jgi:hypothetical protein
MKNVFYAIKFKIMMMIMTFHLDVVLSIFRFCNSGNCIFNTYQNPDWVICSPVLASLSCSHNFHWVDWEMNYQNLPYFNNVTAIAKPDCSINV